MFRLFKPANEQLPKNDPRLFEPVKVQVLTPFLVAGVRQEAGTIITLPRHEAAGLIALGRAVLA